MLNELVIQSACDRQVNEAEDDSAHVDSGHRLGPCGSSTGLVLFVG